MTREPLSVVVTTYNNAATLARCLASVDFAEERLVLDSGSTDGTDPVYGLGMGWQVLPKGNLRVELERYQTDAEGVDMDTDMLSVGFAYKF